MNFKDINIDSDKIEETLEKYAIIESSSGTTSKAYHLNQNGKRFTINVYHKKNGLTSLLPQSENIDIGASLCEKIKEELKKCAL
ncbi:MAG: hypothetical protein COA66_13355 [Arcobacter sp.]|nr:hypothetical protein [Campylobacteraceae bacterium]NQZ85642.1 hypothetical protein [Nanoarchaeales archaeon]PHR69980.1 MAG: hypothetical protein COA66_13355 [Arcobacter sp.]